MFKRILMVCVGNICRSPTAECLLRDRLPAGGPEVSSAGLRALVGEPMEVTAAALLHEHAVDASGHCARQLTTPELLHQADLVLVMEKSHIATIGRMAPQASGKVMLLGKWQSDRDIPDPYGQQRAVFEHVYQLIDQSVTAWLPYLSVS